MAMPIFFKFMYNLKFHGVKTEKYSR